MNLWISEKWVGRLAAAVVMFALPIISWLNFGFSLGIVLAFAMAVIVLVAISFLVQHEYPLVMWLVFVGAIIFVLTNPLFPVALVSLAFGLFFILIGAYWSGK